MLWQYTRRDTKVLLVAVLCTFSAYGFLIGQGWTSRTTDVAITANVVGVFAGVDANAENTLLAQLQEREHALEMREAMAVDRVASGTDDTTLFIVTIVGLALLGLILLNFYLDSKRRGALR